MPIVRGRRRTPARLLALLSIMAIAIAGPTSALAGGNANGLAHRSVDVQILGINDFHGNLRHPPAPGVGSIPAGWAAPRRTMAAASPSSPPTSTI